MTRKIISPTGQNVDIAPGGAGLLTVKGTVGISAIIDDDTMATATDSNVPTAESVVQYIGAQAASPLKDVKVYTASTTWTKPAGMADDDFIIVEGVGGGGGSGGTPATSGTQASSAGAGSGGGYFWKKILGSVLAPSETVTVGVGGTAAAAGANPGGSGGSSSFGTHATATGGLGGQAGTLASAPTGGQLSGAIAGGTASGGDINTPGGTSLGGRAFFNESLSRTFVASGGASVMSNTTQGAGGFRDGKFPGGGAGAPGAATSQAARPGGAGAGGLIRVWEYYK